MTTRATFDEGLQLFILERQLVLQEEAVSARQRRRFLRIASAVVVAGVLASGTGLAAAGTAPLPAAKSAINFLFPDEAPPSDPEPAPTTPTDSAPDGADVTSHRDTQPPAPANAEATPLPAPADETTPGNSVTAPAQASEGTGTAPGISGAHGKPSPPGQSDGHGHPDPPGQQKKG